MREALSVHLFTPYKAWFIHLLEWWQVGLLQRRQFRFLSLSPGVVVSATGVAYPACRFHAQLPNGLRGSWNPKLLFGCQEWASRSCQAHTVKNKVCIAHHIWCVQHVSIRTPYLVCYAHLPLAHHFGCA